MGKILYGKYLDSERNVGVYLTLCVVSEVWFSTIYHLQDILFATFRVEVKVKVSMIEKDS